MSIENNIEKLNKSDLIDAIAAIKALMELIAIGLNTNLDRWSIVPQQRKLHATPEAQDWE
jgi:hypothetical protein